MSKQRSFTIKTARDLLIAVVLVAVVILIGVVTFRWATGSLVPSVPDGKVAVDYVNIVVILLTTVTVLFTVAAIALAIIAAIGLRTMRRGAEQYVRKTIINEAERAFDPGGLAYDLILRQFQNADRPMHKWLRNEIGRQVTERIAYVESDEVATDGEDADDTTDEGDIG